MFTTKVVGYKKLLFKVIAHKDFLFKTSFKQMVLKSLYTLNQRMRYFNLCKTLIMHIYAYA